MTSRLVVRELRSSIGTIRKPLMGMSSFSTLGRLSFPIDPEKIRLPLDNPSRFISAISLEERPDLEQREISTQKYHHTYPGTKGEKIRVAIQGVVHSALGIATSSREEIGPTEFPEIDLKEILRTKKLEAGKLAEVIASAFGRGERISADLIVLIVNQIATEMHGEGEIGEIVRGLFGDSLKIPIKEEPMAQIVVGGESINIVDVESSNLAIQIKKKAFSQELTEQLREADSIRVGGSKKTARANATSYLRRWLFDESRGSIDRFNAEELSKIFRKLHDAGEYNLIVELITCSSNPCFKNDPINLEFYCRANLKSKYANPALVSAIVDFMERELGPSPGVSSIHALIEEIRANVTQERLKELKAGTSSRDVSIEVMQFIPWIDPTNIEALEECYERSLDASLKYYKQIFLTTYDPRYGLRATHQSLARDKADGDGISPDSIEILKETIFACHCDGGSDSNKFPIIRSLFEAELVLDPVDDDKFVEYGSRLIRLCTSDSKLENASSNLQHLKECTWNPKVHEKIDIITRILESKLHKDIDPTTGKEITLENGVAQLFASRPEAAARVSEKERLLMPIHEWERSTYSYRGINSNYIPGNFKFGARLPSQNINRVDLKVFNTIINSMPVADLLPDSGDHRMLSDITDEEEFLTIVDRIIRYRFKTDAWELENLFSEGHKTYDDITKKLIKLAGFQNEAARKAAIDSRTNISMVFALGIGDCRHHAQVKQLLFDTWQRQRLTDAKGEYMKMLEDYYEEDESLGELDMFVGLDELASKHKAVEFLLGTEVRTFDAQIIAPIEMEDVMDASGKTYKVPKVDADGNYFYNEDNIDQVVEEHTMNMLFKYKNYETGEIDEIRVVDAFYQTKYPFGSLRIDATQSLKGGISAGTMKAKRADGSFINIPVKLKPTAYAGTRDEYDRGDATERCVGLSTGLKEPEIILAIQDPSTISRVVRNLNKVSLV